MSLRSANKAHTAAAVAGLASGLDLAPMGDYIAKGCSNLMADTAFGAFSAEVVTIVSHAAVIGISGLVAWLAVYLIPNKAT